MGEIVIVGAGIFGLACGYELLQRGWRVTILERETVGSGASGGVVGTLSPNVPERWNDKKQFQLDALLAARSYWPAVEACSGIPVGYGRIGRLIPIPDARALEHAEIRSRDAVKLWGGKAEWRILPPNTTPGWVAPDITAYGIVEDTLAARLMPAAACAALAACIRSLGGEIIEHWPVSDVSGNEVTGPLGRKTADAVLVTAGVGSFPLLSEYFGKEFGSGVKGQAALLGGVPTRGRLSIYADGVYVVPHVDGTIAVGSTSENTWSDATATDEKLDELLDKARAICPALKNAEVLSRWAGIRPRAKKPDPVLGRVPNQTSLYVATCGFKISFGIAPAVAKAIAEIIGGNAPDIPESFLLKSA